MRASNNTNVKTPIVKNNVITACRVMYFERIFIRCAYD
jgi:hypothetical protein